MQSEVLAASTVLGMSGTGDWSDPELRPLNYREAAFKLFPDSPTPFTKFLTKLPNGTVDDPEFRIFEWRLPTMAWETEVLASTSTTDIPLVAGTSGGIAVGDMLVNESTMEVMRVTAIPDADTITVVRGWGTSTAVNIADGSILRWAGNASEEGSGIPEAVSRRHSVLTNFTQIFKNVADITGTAEVTRMRPEKPWPQLKGEALERHMIQMEHAFLHGVGAETAGSANNIRTTAGFRPTICAAQDGTNSDLTYGTDGSIDMSSLSLDLLDTAMQDVFTYGSKNKLMLCGYTALNYLNKLIRNSTTYNFNDPLPNKQTYGMNIRELVCPFGTLSISPHPLMAESALYTTEAYIIDPKYVEYVSLKSRDTQWMPDAANNDVDAKKGYYMTEAGLRLALPEVHAVWSGISSLAA